MAPPSAEQREPFTALDWIGVVVTTCAILGLAWIAAIGPAFRAMYSDFGDVALPWLSALSTSIFGPLLLALLPSSLLVAGLRLDRIGARRAAVVAAFVVALGCVSVAAVGLYLPLWSVAGALRE